MEFLNQNIADNLNNKDNLVDDLDEENLEELEARKTDL